MNEYLMKLQTNRTVPTLTILVGKVELFNLLGLSFLNPDIRGFQHIILRLYRYLYILIIFNYTIVNMIVSDIS